MPSDIDIDVYQHPFDATKRVVIWPCTRDLDVTQSFGDRPIVPVIMATSSEDRHGSVFNQDGGDFSAYKRNPVVLWSHMTKLPLIANALDLTRDGEKTRSLLDFALDEWEAGGGFNLARVLYRLFMSDKMRAMSQGFLPLEVKNRPAMKMPRMLAENVEYVRWELLEQSAVNVPSNRDAVRSAIGEGLLSGNEADFLLGFGFSLHADEPVQLRAVATECKCCAKASPDCGCATKDKSKAGTCSCHADCAKCKAQDCGGMAAVTVAKEKAAPDPDADEPVRTSPAPPVAPIVTEPPASDVPAMKPATTKKNLRALRRSFEEALKRCGCDYVNPCCNDDDDDDEVLTPEEQAGEIQAISDMAQIALSQFDQSIAAWRAARHEKFRAFAAWQVQDAMLNFSALADMLDEWYELDLDAGQPVTPESDEIGAIAEFTTANPQKFARTGAVLNAGNRAKLQRASDIHGKIQAMHDEMGAMITDVLTSAEKQADEAPTAGRVTMSPDIALIHSDPRIVALSGVSPEQFAAHLQKRIGGASRGSDATLSSPDAEDTDGGSQPPESAHGHGYSIDLKRLKLH